MLYDFNTGKERFKYDGRFLFNMKSRNVKRLL